MTDALFTMLPCKIIWLIGALWSNTGGLSMIVVRMLLSCDPELDGSNSFLLLSRSMLRFLDNLTAGKEVWFGLVE